MIQDMLPELIAFTQIVFIDLVLAGDNAIVVGMAAASVPLEQRHRVIFWGTAAAVILRILFAVVATQLLQIIGLTLAGGLLLTFVCYEMWRELRSHGKDEVTPEEAEQQKGVAKTTPHKTVTAAVWQVAMADLSMSLDNVLAVAGVAQDHMAMLVAGLLLSVILMAFAANYVAKIIHKHRWVAWVGLAIITYVAANMIYRGSFQVLDALAAMS
ncbi:MAG: TerC family protein [Magnetococcales bacterium]|nr:TerC family protein [Magnetococcales bacterium]